MNTLLPTRPKGYKIRIAIYSLLIGLCIIAVGIAIYQFFTNEKLGVILGISTADDEETEELKSKFYGIFTNKITQNNSNQSDLVFTDYQEHSREPNNFDLNVNIPCINIDSELAKKYNNQIKEDFEEPAKYIKQTQSRNISYTVNYMATVNGNILSLAILSTFKEGANAQRTMFKTFNYDIAQNNEVTIENLIQIANTEKNKVESKIEYEIKKSQDQVEKMRELGYEIYSRNIGDSIYKIQNTKEFFMYDNRLYIIYAYGNDNNTSEMDLVII